MLTTSADLTTKEEFTYTDQGRLLTQTHQINGGTKQLIAKNDYDELGQLIGKKVGGTDITGAIGLQTVDYAYNVRGWLKQINNPASLGTDLFGFKINYNTVSHGATPLYNGNISETEWKTQNDNVLRWYRYGYDNLNRITSATAYSSNYNVSGIGYDKNGNIMNLTRRGHTNIGGTTFGVMDQLTYTYPTNSNKLTIVSDAGNDTFGFKDDQIGTGTDITTDYTYDANGNMKTDANKGITAITYNHLNLPTSVTLAGGTISYIYDATGVKQRKVAGGTTTEYAGNYLYQGGTLQFFNHPEGYVENNAGVYKYYYQFKDHLGNIRLSYTNNGTATTPNVVIADENNYYPFGLRHKGYNDAITPYGNSAAKKFKFGGKELQDDVIGGTNIDWYDFHARNYDPALGRWMNVDPKAHQMPAWSPYSAMFNNPILFVDPDGQYPIIIHVRSFAPFSSFGPLNFWKGDGSNRSFTTNTAGSRISMVTNYETETQVANSTAKGAMTFSKYGARAYSDAYLNKGQRSVTTTGNSLDLHLYGKNEALIPPVSPMGWSPGGRYTPSPDIDIHNRLTINATDGVLSISGQITGDQFPSAEAFVSDDFGTSIMLGTFATSGDRQMGPVTELFRDRNLLMMDVNIKISVGENGAFQGVYSTDSKGNEIIMSPDAWKEQYESQSTTR